MDARLRVAPRLGVNELLADDQVARQRALSVLGRVGFASDFRSAAAKSCELALGALSASSVEVLERTPAGELERVAFAGRALEGIGGDGQVRTWELADGMGTLAVTWDRPPGPAELGFVESAAAILSGALRREQREREARLHAQLLDEVEGAVAGLARDGTIRYWSAGAERLFGLPRPCAVGRRLTEVVTSGLELALSAAAAGHRVQVEVSVRRDGAEVPVLVTLSRTAGDDGTLACLAVDLTENRVLARSLRAARDRVAAVVAAAPLILWACDAEGVVTMSTGRALGKLGQVPGEIVGRNIQDLFRNREDILAALHRALAGEQVVARTALGRWEFETHYLPVRGEDGGVEGVTGVFVDVTGQAPAEEEPACSHERLLERLALVVELRDDATGEHTRRVGRLASRIAAALGLDNDSVELIGRAAPLHDLGKVALPDEILLKPGKLSAEEFELVKTHTEVGARILAGADSPVLRLAEVIARYHHERYDGSGYYGLSGQGIPLAARIAAVADVYDALTSDRPYRRAFSPEEARRHMAAGRGRDFDPAVVDAFLEVCASESAGVA